MLVWSCLPAHGLVCSSFDVYQVPNLSLYSPFYYAKVCNGFVTVLNCYLHGIVPLLSQLIHLQLQYLLKRWQNVCNVV